jgi:hypothetical protein
MNLFPNLLKALALAGMAASAAAAPLDALIEAMPSQRYGEGYLEFGADAMNSTLDVFKVRSQMGITDNTGNYQGFSLRAGRAFGNGGWLDGAYMRRHITVGADQYPVTSWRVGAQQILRENPTAGSALALRGSVWGNTSANVTKSKFSLDVYNTSIYVDRVSAIRPKDQHYQFDLVNSWYGSQWSGSVFAGLGSGRVTIPGVEADFAGGTYTYPSDTVNAFTAIGGVSEHLGTLNYSLKSQQLGLNASYVTGAWMYRAGYVMAYMRRPSVDSAVQSLGNTPYQRNQTLVGEVAYKFTQSVHAYTRAQVMQRQFLSEIPFLYNSITSPIFGVKYGVVSAGLGFSF